MAIRTTTALVACATIASGTIFAAQPAHAGPDQDQFVFTRKHVDAPIPAWDPTTQTLAVNASERPARGSVLWVPRGWSGSTPRHYFTVPQNPNFTFLGEANKTWYSAPQVPGTQNTPIWAGIGAHGSVTENAHRFEASNYVLDFVNVNGPGRVEAFIASTGINRLWSSSDLGHRTVWNPRHMHHYTVFSKPGRYEVNVAAVARAKDGTRIYTSPITPLVWQVGGTDPRLGKIKDYGAAYNAARATRSDNLSQGGKLTVQAKTRYLQAGDERLSDITFDTGNHTDKGRVIILINGFYLAELEVVNGRAAYDEFLGDENSTLQAIYIPEDTTSARYITAPFSYIAGNKTALSSVGRASSVEPPRPARSAVLEPNSHIIEDPELHLSITPPSEPQGDYRVELEGDANLNASLNITFHKDARSDVIDCGVEKFMAHGLFEASADLNYCKNAAVMRVAVLPHPYSNAKPQVFELPQPTVADGIDTTFTLQLREGNENHAPAEKLPGFTATPIVEDDSVVDSPLTPNRPGDAGGTTLPPVVDTPSAPAETMTEPLSIHRGHMDVRLAQQPDKTWAFVIKDDSLLGARTSVLRDPASVTVHVSPAAREARKESLKAPSFDFLGPIGTINYVLPEVENTQLPWPGFSTEDIDYAAFPEGIQYYVRAKSVPAGSNYFFVTSSDLGENVNLLVDSRNPNTNVISTSEATHLHGSWVFSKAGRYELEVIAQTGEKLLARAPLTFAVDTEHAGAGDETPLPQNNSGSTAPQGENTQGHAPLSTNELANALLNNAGPAPVAASTATRNGNGGVLGMLGAASATGDDKFSADKAQSADMLQSAHAPQSGALPRAAVTTLRAGGPQSGEQPASSAESQTRAETEWSTTTLIVLATLGVLGLVSVLLALRARQRNS